MVLGIRAKLILITVAILLFVVGATTVTNTYFFSKRYLDLHKSRASAIGKSLKYKLDYLLDLEIPLADLIGFEKQCLNLVNEYDEITYAMIVDTRGRILFHNDPAQHDNAITDPHILDALAIPEESVYSYAKDGVEYYESVIPVFANKNEHIASVRLGFPSHIIAQQSKELIMSSLVVAVISLVLVMMLLVVPLTSWFTKPIKKLVEVMEEIRSVRTDLTKRVSIDSKDEIGRLAYVFNQMMGDLEIHQKDLEYKVQERTARLESFTRKLEQSNTELEQFAYIASHDLQEPLRKVTGFGSRLKDKYADIIDENGRDYINRMMNAASRMQSLINGLLDYSRVTTKAEPFTTVDLSGITKEVLSDLEVRIEQSGAEVELHDLPTVEADPLQMRQLFQNLIGNALKFSKEGEPPVVKVHGQPLHAEQADRGLPSNGTCEISVEDNGIGFDEKYADHIFGIFQRLHGRSEYEGTGIGLSVCKKIVERHKGHIEVKSRSGEGASFIITLPVHQTTGGET